MGSRFAIVSCWIMVVFVFSVQDSKFLCDSCNREPWPWPQIQLNLLKREVEKARQFGRISCNQRAGLLQNATSVRRSLRAEEDLQVACNIT